MIADGVLLRAARSAHLTRWGVREVYYTRGDTHLRLITEAETTVDLPALPIAEITSGVEGEQWQWVDEHALAVVDEPITPLRDELLTIACAIYREGPVLIVDSARPTSAVPVRLAVLVQGPTGNPRDGLLGAADYLFAHAGDGLAARALAAGGAVNYRITCGYVVDTGDSPSYADLLAHADDPTPPQPTAPATTMIPLAYTDATTLTWAWNYPDYTTDHTRRLRQIGYDHGLLPFTASTLPRQAADTLRVTTVAQRILRLGRLSVDPATGWITAAA